MKVRLLNDGGYWGLSAVKFPVIVDAIYDGEGLCKVPASELRAIGFTTSGYFESLCFFVGSECELIEAVNE